jgi:retron-type reverse transcriptase
LIERLREKVCDKQVLSLLENIIKSFETKTNKGISLGNLTSQLFSNVYLDIFDQFTKRNLGVKSYIRYADDFIILSEDKNELILLLAKIQNFLNPKIPRSLLRGFLFRKYENVRFSYKLEPWSTRVQTTVHTTLTII